MEQRPALPQAFFLDTGDGPRFCLYHPPAGPARGRVLYLPPFADELNHTRRVVAQQARALARTGFAVLQIDLRGCGDSDGELADTRWADWLADARQGLQALRERATQGPLWLWGLRTGALLASALAEALDEPAHLLLWQPAIQGRQVLQQFLRLQAAGQWLAPGAPAAGLPSQTPAQALAQGQSVHIGGHTLNPDLARDLEQARLRPPVVGPATRRLVWLERTSGGPSPGWSPATDQALATWRLAGWQVQALYPEAPPFWANAGLDDAPDWQRATLDALNPSDDTPDAATAPGAIP